MEIKHVVKAQTLDEVLELLEENQEKCKIIAGGTDFVIQLREGNIRPEVIIDISGTKDLSFIRKTDNYIEIGAATTFNFIKNSPLISSSLRGLKEAASLVGSPQIRNLGTVGGNICNASPAADTAPPLLALGAIAVIKNKQHTREIPLEDFYLDRGRVKLEPDELLFSLKFDQPQNRQGLGFVKLGLRNALAISSISIAVFMDLEGDNTCKDIRIGSGALSKTPVREKDVEAFFKGRTLNDELIDQGAIFFGRILEQRLDGRPPAERNYKPYAIKGVFKEAFEKTLAVID